MQNGEYWKEVSIQDKEEEKTRRRRVSDVFGGAVPSFKNVLGRNIMHFLHHSDLNWGKTRRRSRYACRRDRTFPKSM